MIMQLFPLVSNENKSLRFAVLLILLYVSPLWILGEGAHIRVHDNMDSNLAWYRVLVQSGEWFGSVHASIPQVINGLPRNALGTEWSGIVALHAFLPTMSAYAVSQTTTRLIAFLGMYVLLRYHVTKNKNETSINVGVALAFALTPFWPSGMLSTLGQPLALWALLNIRKGGGGWKEWLVLVGLPFYSSLILGFFFFLAAVFMLWLWDGVVAKRWSMPFLYGILVMGLVYVSVEYRLLASLVIADEPTSRNEFISSRLHWPQALRLTLKNFIYGHNHVKTLHTWIILPVTVVTLLLLLGKRKWRSEPIARIFILLFAGNMLLSLWYSFWFHVAWKPLKEQFSILTTFNFARFHFLRPMIIYVGFAAACVLWSHQGGKWGRTASKAVIVLQVLLLFSFNEEIFYRVKRQPSFQQFYAEEQFREIDTYIGRPKETYRVVSIGLHPAIAQFNGFYTLDAYNNYYPLSYKHTFRKVIAKELEKSPKLRAYFDQWGGRCYLFVAELGKKYDYRKTSRKQVHNLELNVDILKQLGGRYIFSAVPIRNANANQLMLLRVFDHKQSAWKVYLYEVE
jgi:hypothetical protein